MEAILANIVNPTDEDITNFEVLYNSIASSSLPEFPENTLEDLDLCVEDMNDDPQVKSLLNIIIQKCFNKIKTDRYKIETHQRELEETQFKLQCLQEENSNLKETQDDYADKIEYLKNFIDQTEASNDILQKKLVQFQNHNKELEVSIDKKKTLTSIHDSSFEQLDTEALKISKNFQKEIEKQREEIKSLRETINLQEQVIEKLHTEVESQHDIQTKNKHLKKELNDILKFERSNGKIGEKMQSLSASIKRSVSSPSGSFNSYGNNSHLRAPSFYTNDEDETNNRNLLSKYNSRSITDAQFKPFEKQNSLVEDIINSITFDGSRGNSPVASFSATGFNKGKKLRSLAKSTMGLVSDDNSNKQRILNNMPTTSTFDTECERYLFDNRSSDEKADIYEDLELEQSCNSSLQDNNSDMSDKENKRIETNQDGVLSPKWSEDKIIKLTSPINSNQSSSKSKEIIFKEDQIDVQTNIHISIDGFSDLKMKEEPFFGIRLNSSTFRRDGYSIQERIIAEVDTIKRKRRSEQVDYSFGNFNDKSIQNSAKEDKKSKRLSAVISQYISSEINEANKNTSFSIFRIIKVLIFRSTKY